MSIRNSPQVCEFTDKHYFCHQVGGEGEGATPNPFGTLLPSIGHDHSAYIKIMQPFIQFWMMTEMEKVWYVQVSRSTMNKDAAEAIGLSPPWAIGLDSLDVWLLASHRLEV